VGKTTWHQLGGQKGPLGPTGFIPPTHARRKGEPPPSFLDTLLHLCQSLLICFSSSSPSPVSNTGSRAPSPLSLSLSLHDLKLASLKKVLPVCRVFDLLRSVGDITIYVPWKSILCIGRRIDLCFWSVPAFFSLFDESIVVLAIFWGCMCILFCVIRDLEWCLFFLPALSLGKEMHI